MKINSVSFYTLGCRLNQSETAIIENTFKQNGFNIKESFEPSDIAVINTCTVTERGDSDTRKIANKIVRINPDVKIALIGCQSQIQKKKLVTLPNIYWIVGTEKKMDIASIIKHSNKETKFPNIIIPAIKKDIFKNPAVGIYRNHTRANIKIQDGCDFFCSFCEIPYARGRARSRDFKDIIFEAKALSSAGHKEIVITGINVGTYKQGKYTLIDVISALEDIKGLKRIRISSIEPTTISKKIINKMSKNTKLCRYLHIPIQSGSDKILKAMKRKYTFSEFKDFIYMAHNKISDLSIGTDIIVGFPIETENMFKETEKRIRELPINHLHIFSYSKRNLAKSKDITGQIPAKTIKERSRILRALRDKKIKDFYKSFIGKSAEVLFEQKNHCMWSGLTDNYIKVKVNSSKNLSNQIKSIKLLKLQNQFLTGEIKE